MAVCLTMSAFYLFEALNDPGRVLPSSLSWLPVAQVVALVAAFLILPVGLIVQIRLLAPERNFLRLDAAGLTFTRFGKSRTWAWPELSPFERDHTFHSRIKFFLPNLDPKQARRDRWVHEMTPKGAMVVIPDAYDTQLDKIIAQLNAFRARVLGERPDADGAGTARPSPAAAAMPPVTFGEKPWRKWLTLAICLPLSLFCWIFTVVFAKDLLAVAGASGTPATWLQFWIAIFALTGAVGATAMAVVTLLFGRSLRLDDAGLTYTRRPTSGRGSENRHWSWSELSAFEHDDTGVPGIRFCLPKLDPEQARRDPWVQQVTPEGALIVVHDIYDAPLDEIAAKLNDYRDRALAAAPGEA
jgi:hypothetical protein